LGPTRTPDWHLWLARYDDPGSPHGRRLAAVQGVIARWLDETAPRSVSILSLCAGDGRDVIGVLADRADAERIAATLVELDPRLCQLAEAAIRKHRLSGIQVRRADAGLYESYADLPPADLVILVGLFGNVADEDVQSIIAALPGLCADQALVVWSLRQSPRERPAGRRRAAQNDRDRVDTIRGWFARARFEEVFAGERDAAFHVGAHRNAVMPRSEGGGGGEGEARIARAGPGRFFTFELAKSDDPSRMSAPSGSDAPPGADGESGDACPTAVAPLIPAQTLEYAGTSARSELIMSKQQDVAWLEKLHEDFVEALRSNDYDALGAYYTDDAVLLPPGHVLVAGRDAIIEYWKEAERIQDLVFETTHVTTAGGEKVVREAGNLLVTSRGRGRETRNTASKYVSLWLQVDGAWKLNSSIWNGVGGGGGRDGRRGGGGGRRGRRGGGGGGGGGGGRLGGRGRGGADRDEAADED
jgi:uncharacterized protein (TIGR02246 family)